MCNMKIIRDRINSRVKLSCFTCFRVFTLSWIGLGKPTRVSVSLQKTNVSHTQLHSKWWYQEVWPRETEDSLSQSESDELVSAGFQEVLDVLLPVGDRNAAVRFWIHLRTSAQAADTTTVMCMSVWIQYSYQISSVCAKVPSIYPQYLQSQVKCGQKQISHHCRLMPF